MSKRRRSPPKHRPKQPNADAHHGLPEICVLVISSITEDDELIAVPVKYDTRRKPPHIVVTESGRSRAASVGDRVLAKLRKIKPQLYQALVIRVLPNEKPLNITGVFVATADGGIIEPVSRKNKESYMVARGDTAGARHGELVSGVTLPGVPSMSMTFAKITERLGRLDAPRAASMIAAQMHSLPSVFSEAALAESEAASQTLEPKNRVDLRHLPLVTIDGEDARDFDDAVYAQKDGDGWHVWIAIADVAYYVTEGSALDADAFERGNSVYFPDRVIPMLPERLSNGLCSLVPGQDRYCLAVQLWLDAQGNTKKYTFMRGIMRSKARLTYKDVEAAYKSRKHPLHDEVIEPLYGAYEALAAERERRGALDLNLPEYQIIFDASGNVANIAQRERLESHKLIEAYMIAANVAAADFLLKKRAPGIYRVHETPADERLDDLVNFLKMSGYSLHVGAGIKASHFNRVLRASDGEPNAAMIHTAVLRSQMQAYYSSDNLGHFGLSLQKYCHFTSPIRRYSDLVVHRSLVALIEEQPIKKSGTHLAEVALHISETERRAMMAERDASDRYKVSYMSNHVGDVFPGTIASLNEYGLFVSLRDTGITGFVPVRSLPGDFFLYDKRHSCFKGQRSKQVYTIGMPIVIRVQTANAITGSLIFELERPPLSEEPPLRPKDKHKHHQRRQRKHHPKHRR